jgi:hypothetical protein
MKTCFASGIFAGIFSAILATEPKGKIADIDAWKIVLLMLELCKKTF